MGMKNQIEFPPQMHSTWDLRGENGDIYMQKTLHMGMQRKWIQLDFVHGIQIYSKKSATGLKHMDQQDYLCNLQSNIQVHRDPHQSRMDLGNKNMEQEQAWEDGKVDNNKEDQGNDKEEDQGEEEGGGGEEVWQ